MLTICSKSQTEWHFQFTVYSAGKGNAGWCDKSVSGGMCRWCPDTR